mmetsp:Transcript_18585/g.46097  ORF Transcript_18585/g.46097 Transcript_18585/m.46097 type:complete len:269 (+) Transcript_18585:337-1143(+)
MNLGLGGTGNRFGRGLLEDGFLGTTLFLDNRIGGSNGWSLCWLASGFGGVSLLVAIVVQPQQKLFVRRQGWLGSGLASGNPGPTKGPVVVLAQPAAAANVQGNIEFAAGNPLALFGACLVVAVVDIGPWNSLVGALELASTAKVVAHSGVTTSAIRKSFVVETGNGTNRDRVCPEINVIGVVKLVEDLHNGCFHKGSLGLGERFAGIETLERETGDIGIKGWNLGHVNITGRSGYQEVGYALDSLGDILDNVGRSQDQKVVGCQEANS